MKLAQERHATGRCKHRTRQTMKHERSIRFCFFL